MRYSLLFILFYGFQINLSIAGKNYFTENKGQIDESVLFYHQSPNQNIVLYSDGFGYDNYKLKGDNYIHHRTEIRFQNINKKKIIKTAKPLGFFENFYGEFKEILNVRSYEIIVFKDVYKNIDLRFLISESGLFKYDVIVHPGGNINDVCFKVEGAPVVLSENKLVFELAFGTMEEKIPESFIEETRELININYVQKKKGLFGFAGFSINSLQTLIIDPTPNLVWGTYYGGTNIEDSYSNEPDGAGNFYQTGKTLSNNNISTSGAFQTSLAGNYDAYLAKFDTSGKLIWATYYGGSGDDQFRGVHINKLNEILIVGNTTGSSGLATSGAYKTSNSGGQDALLVKFSNSGSRIWASYFGGSSTEDIYQVISDKAHNMYFSGKSSSSGLATSGAHQTTYAGGEDGLMFSFNNSGGLRWSTYLGGTAQDYFWELIINDDQFIYVSGHTYSSTGVSLNAKHQSSYAGGGDAFIVKMDTTGKLHWSNYFGGTGLDNAIELISDGINLISVGHTTSTSGIASSGAYKTTNSGNTDGYVSCFDTSGKRIWSTYIGGTGFEEVYAVTYANNKIMIAGKTSSSSGISSSDAFQKSLGGGLDCFIMKLDMNGYVLWGTYYGGSGDDRSVSLRYYWGSLYLCGATYSTTNIATSGAHSTSLNGSQDAFIARFDNLGCDLKYFGKMVRPCLCQGDSTGIAAVIMYGTSGNPSFTWKTNPPQYKDTAFGLPSGVYEVIVTDTFGCKDSLKVTILSPVRLGAFVKDSVHVSCNGKKDGILIADAVGGTQPYFFRWLTAPNVTDDSLTGLGVGTYKVLVTDNNNCRDSTTARITEPDQLKSNITGYNNPTCFLLNNGQISVTVTGGTQPYSYNWSTSPSQKTSTAYNITAGYYEVIITDKNGCTTKTSYTLTEPSPIAIGLTGLNHSLCFNDSLGSISTLIWGGTPGYKLEWNNNPSFDKNNLSKLRGGTYRLSVTDANNCTESKTFTINEPNQLVIQFDTILGPKCNGYADGRIVASVGGGTPSYKLSWNTPPYSDVYRVTGLKAGLYTLTVKDSFNCTHSDSVVLQNVDSLIVKASIIMPKCFDGKDGKITTEVKGGTAPYTFLWSHNPTLNLSQLNNISAGNYYLNVKDNAGCNVDAQFIINQPNKLQINKQLQQDVTCYNGSNGTLSVAVAGGTPPLRQKWSAGSPSDALSIHNLKAGFYSISLTDSNGCADSANYQIKEPFPLLGYFDSIFSPSCYAYQNGYVTYKATGGIRPYTYSFDNGPVQFDSVAFFVKSGWINVKVIDNNGCTLLDSSLISQPAKLSFNPEVNQISCYSFQDGKIIINGNGGIKPYRFSWSHMSADTNIAFNLDQGVYFVTVSDKNNCHWKDTVQIIQPEELQGKVDLTIPASCYNVDNGMATGTAVGGTPTYEFFWKGPQNYNGQSVSGMRAGNYIMFVKDKNGCLDSLGLTIGQPDRVISSIKAVGTPSCVDSADGWAEVVPLFGVAPYTFRWSNGTTEARANNLAKGNYSVIITDKCGDTAMAYITILDPAPFIIPNISGIRSSFRGKQEVYEIADVSGWSYIWEVSGGTIVSGQGNSKITVRWESTGKGNILVKVFSGSGCYDENFILVSITAECMYVLPNPSNMVTNVILPSIQNVENLQIFDARGRKVIETEAFNQNEIDVSHFARGVYFIRYNNCVIKFLKS